MSKLYLGDIAALHGNLLSVDLWYPRVDDAARTADHPVEVEVGLCDVRAADSIRVSYDFERDGYIIKQQPEAIESGDGESEEVQPWREVAFVKAWGLHK